MGLSKLVKRGVSALKGREPSPAETANKYKFEQSIYEEREKGRLEGAKKRAYEEGKQKGYGKGGSIGRVGGALNRLDSGARAVNHGLGNAEKLFSVNSGPSLGNYGSGGNGLDFGFGGFGSQQKQEAKRITKVNPRTGAVTITETGGDIGQTKRKKQSQGINNFFDDIDQNNPF